MELVIQQKQRNGLMALIAVLLASGLALAVFVQFG
jgi:hypothetical protein